MVKFGGTASDLFTNYGTVKFSSQPTEKLVTFNNTTGSGKQGTIDLFQVTGTVLVKLVVISKLTPVGTGGTLIVGTPTTTNGLLTIQTATNLTTGKIWYDNAIGIDCLATSSKFGEYMISDTAKIIATVATADLTAGSLLFLCSWVPLSAGANVVAL